MEPQIRYARRKDGARTAYAVSGSGPVMMYTPGFTSHLEWNLSIHAGDPRFRAELARRRTLVDYDRHGCGLSDRNRKDFTPDGDMQDIEAVISAIGAEEVDIFGISFGGYVAVRYAAEHPDRVRKVILWGASPLNDRSLFPREIRSRTAALAELRRSDYELSMRMLASQLFPSGVAPEVFRSLVDTNRQAASPEMLERLDTVVFDNRGLLAQVTAPTLVLHRRGDQMVPFAAGQYLARRLPNARFVPLDGDEHLPNFGDVGSVITPIVQFLDEGAGDAAVTPHRATDAAGTAIILFTDIADSTAHTERMGDAAFRAAARALDVALRQAVRDAGGTLIDAKTLGDGILATFASAAQAIEAAKRCLELSAASELGLHIGLHAGDVIREEGNVFGGAVNIAARICALSGAGEILVSQTVRDLARTSAGVTFEDRGERALKGIADPVRVYAVVEGAG